MQKTIETNSYTYKPRESESPARLELGEDAFHGIIGRYVRSMAEITEADPAALHGHYLGYFGSIVGGKAYHLIEGRRHYTNLFIALVGESSKGRKGTARARVEQVFREAVAEYVDRNVLSGLYSGEGLIHHVRDASPDFDPDDPKSKADQGVHDKRRLFIEEELASPFYRMRQNGNTLSPVLRNAWDRMVLQTVIKNEPDVATGADISVIGHGVKEELVEVLDSKTLRDGLANRFIWLYSERAQFIPRPRHEPHNMDTLVSDLQHALSRVESVYSDTLVDWDKEAAGLWDEVYPSLSVGASGVVGNLTKRAEANTLRIALIYAVMDGSPDIRTEHLLAAIAVWQHSMASIKRLFGDVMTNPIAHKLSVALTDFPEGMTRSEIHRQFNGHVEAKDLAAAISELDSMGRAEEIDVQTNGRTKKVVRIKR